MALCQWIVLLPTVQHARTARRRGRTSGPSHSRLDPTHSHFDPIKEKSSSDTLSIDLYKPHGRNSLRDRTRLGAGRVMGESALDDE